MNNSIPSGRRCTDALRQTLKRVYDPTTRTPIPWLLTGKAALQIHGVPIEPDTIEFRAISPFATAYFAQLMKPYEAPDTAATIVYRLGGNTPPSSLWRSNVHQRVVAWSSGGRATWLGRWPLDEMDIARLTPTQRANRSASGSVVYARIHVPGALGRHGRRSCSAHIRPGRSRPEKRHGRNPAHNAHLAHFGLRCTRTAPRTSTSPAGKSRPHNALPRVQHHLGIGNCKVSTFFLSRL